MRELASNAAVIVFLAALCAPLAVLLWLMRRFVGRRAPSWREVAVWFGVYVGGCLAIFSIAQRTDRIVTLLMNPPIQKMLPPFDIIDPFATPAIVLTIANLLIAVRDRRRADSHVAA